MAIYYAPFVAVAVTAAQDLFEITSPAGIKVAIREIVIGQYTEFADAQSELLSILLMRGHTITGSGGSTLTPITRSGHSAATAATSVVKANNTTVATGGSPETMVADSFNVAAGWVYRPGSIEGVHRNPAGPTDERIILQPSTRLVCRITAPADSITMNGTLVFEELGVDYYKSV